MARNRLSLQAAALLKNSAFLITFEDDKHKIRLLSEDGNEFEIDDVSSADLKRLRLKISEHLSLVASFKGRKFGGGKEPPVAS